MNDLVSARWDFHQPALHGHRPVKVERLNLSVGQNETSHAEDRRQPPDGMQRPIGADRAAASTRTARARRRMWSFCAAAIARMIPCSLSDTRGQVGQWTSMAVCAVQAKISMMDSSEGTASPTRKWSYTCWISAARRNGASAACLCPKAPDEESLGRAKRRSRSTDLT